MNCLQLGSWDKHGQTSYKVVHAFIIVLGILQIQEANPSVRVGDANVTKAV